MMKKCECFFPLVGRMCLSSIFLLSAANKASHWEQTTGYMASKGMLAVSFFLFGALVLEISGGLSVLFGYRAKFGALALIAFLLPVTFIFHDFWNLSGMGRQVQMIMFMKNISILGGLLLVLGFGSGPLSLDNAKRSRASS